MNSNMIKRLLLAALIWIASWPALAAVAFDAQSTSGVAGSGGPTYSWTHTPVGTPTAVGVWITSYNGATGFTPTGVTYGGSSMTLALTGSGSLNDLDTLYCLTSPPSGAQTVVITFGGTGQYFIAAAVTVTGSSTSTCFRNTGNTPSTSATSPASTTLTTVSGDLVVDMMQVFSGSAITKGGSQTLAWGPNSQSALNASGSYQAATSTSTTMTWTWTGGSTSEEFAGAFEVGSGGGAVVHTLPLMGVGK